MRRMEWCNGHRSWVMGNVGHGLTVWWVTWVTGHERWPISISATAHYPNSDQRGTSGGGALKWLISTWSPTSTNVQWIRNCSAYSEPMTSHALGELAGSRRTLRAASGRHGRRYLESITSYQKSYSVSRCAFTWVTVLSKFIPIRFETT